MLYLSSLEIIILCKLPLLLHPFNGLFFKTTWVSWHQEGKPFWILLEQEMTGWQWHQLDHMQVHSSSLQTDALPLCSKGRYGSFHLWINVRMAGKTV